MTKGPVSHSNDAELPLATSDASDERSFFAEQAAKPASLAKQASLSASLDKEEHYRERLRDRFRQHGDTALADYELLELLLFRLIPGATPSRSPKRCSSASARSLPSSVHRCLCCRR